MQQFNIDPSKEQTALENQRVLIADADIQSRNILSLVLRKLGAIVEELSSGKDAYELLQRKTYRKSESINFMHYGHRLASNGWDKSFKAYSRS